MSACSSDAVAVALKEENTSGAKLDKRFNRYTPSAKSQARSHDLLSGQVIDINI